MQRLFPFWLWCCCASLRFSSKGWGSAVPKGGEINSGDVAWMLTASGLVLLMTPGLSFFYGGMVSFKNVVSTMLQSWSPWGSSAWSGWWWVSAWPSATTSAA